MRAAWWTRLAVVFLVALGGSLAGAGTAGAHPLGNFTTNRHARIAVGAEVVRVHYVLDEAELVAFRQRDALAVEGVVAFRDRRVEELRSGLRLEAGGELVSLRTVASKLSEPSGQGGLSTLRIEAVYEGALAGSGRVRISFEDGNGPQLLGWREIVVGTSAGASLVTSSDEVPTVDRSDRLRRYPTDPGAAPLDVRAVRFDVVPGRGVDRAAGLAAAAGGDGGDGGVGGVGDRRFVDIVGATSSSPVAVGGALLAAFVFGVVHAVGPGHGKTVMAAYLVSTRGRRRDAFALGAVVSLMHTASVLALAGLLVMVGPRLDAARLYPLLTLAAGVLVSGVGARLLVQRRRSTRRPAMAHDHVAKALPTVVAASAAGADHARAVALLDRPPMRPAAYDAAADHAHGHRQPEREHEHDHQHGHHHGPGGHTHDLPADVRPLSRRGLVALGASGGLFPSPSAVVVLVGAFALGRAALGLALIAAFSLGLAAMLVAVGLLLVAGRDRLLRSRFAPHLPWLPIAGAAAIVVLGAVLLLQGTAQIL